MNEPRLPRQLAETTGYRLVKLGELALDQADEALMPLGLSAREFNVLAAAADGARSQRQLSAISGLNATLMVGVIDRRHRSAFSSTC